MYMFAGSKALPLSGQRALVGSLLGAAATAVCTQVTIPLPGHLVPITLQVFAVICCGLLLGSRYGALAQLEYLAAGILGAPVFAFHKAGPAVLVGPTGGYLVGFVGAAFVVGLFIERAGGRTFRTAAMAGLLGVGVIHTFGAAWLAVWSGWVFHGAMVWAWGSAPFVGVDVVKVLVAARIFGGRS